MSESKSQAKIIVHNNTLPTPIQCTFTENDEIQIGRSPACTIAVADSRLSRVHCRLFFDQTRYCVEDLGSTNGTFINSNKVRIVPKKPTSLVHGDIIHIGETQVHIQIGSVNIEKPASASPLQIGDYQVVKLLGSGGIGDVYLVKHITTQELFALKLIKSSAALDADMVKRFTREAKAYAKLRDHPALIKIYDMGTYEDLPYLVLEYAPGQSLSDFVYTNENHRLPPKLALQIAAPIASALAYAHSQKIVHRDIKPSNILIMIDSQTKAITQVKLIDLGMAKLLNENGITVPGTTLGTPRYMPIEQIEDAGGSSHLVDIYSLGATIYSMIAGVPPYAEVKSNQLTELLRHILKYEPMPIGELVPNIPVPVKKLIGKAMERKPQDRFQTADALHQVIVQALKQIS